MRMLSGLLHDQGCAGYQPGLFQRHAEIRMLEDFLGKVLDKALNLTAQVLTDCRSHFEKSGLRWERLGDITPGGLEPKASFRVG